MAYAFLYIHLFTVCNLLIIMLLSDLKFILMETLEFLGKIFGIMYMSS